MSQNTSHAVMSQRTEPRDSMDFFPTPAWATRALIKHVIGPRGLELMTCLEPACGPGHMSKPLGEYFGHVTSSDIVDYGYGGVKDFLADPYEAESYDWVITNPPFNRMQEFILKALDLAREGVAILARTQFLEGIGRYNDLFKTYPPYYVAPFCERVPMVKGRVDRKASTATSYAWFMWYKNYSEGTSVRWIPPCRKELERDEDYE